MGQDEYVLMDENDKLREFSTLIWGLLTGNEPRWVWEDLEEQAHELGLDKGEGKMALKVTRCEFLFGIPCSQVADRMIKIEDENDKLREQALRAYNLAATEFCWLKKPEPRKKIEAHLDEIDGFLTDIKRKLAELGVDE